MLYLKANMATGTDSGCAALQQPGVAVATHSAALARGYAFRHPAVVSTADILTRNENYWSQNKAEMPSNPSAI